MEGREQCVEGREGSDEGEEVSRVLVERVPRGNASPQEDRQEDPP